MFTVNVQDQIGRQTVKAALLFALTAALATGCTQSRLSSQGTDPDAASGSSADILHIDHVEWERLNPARGDKSPKAATLWGDRNGMRPTGFLVQFVDGFSSPPHIHNVTYRGVVIRGLVHNDDPNAAEMWMPSGSFWTQPKGEVHITAARGDTNIAYIEIDEGPYLVLPSPDAFDSGERPINIDASNIVWQMLDGAMSVQSALLWGRPSTGQLHGRFIKLPAAFDGQIEFTSGPVHGVVIQGAVSLGATQSSSLAPGSSFSTKQPGAIVVRTGSASESIVYLRMSGDMAVRNR
jgi:Domain of unknown function (DUF4437)